MTTESTTPTQSAPTMSSADLERLKGIALFPFISPPNGGKGTQTARLSQHFGIPRIDMGATLREIGKQDTPIGRKVRDTQAQGMLVDLPTVLEALQAGLVNELKAHEGIKGFILDGFPRNDDQARGLFDITSQTGAVIAKAIYLNVPDEAIIDRAAHRRFHPETGEIFSIKGKSGNDAELAPDGAKLIQRVDDQPEKVRVRLESFAKDTMPILELFQQQGVLVEVDGNRPVDTITQELIALMEPALK